MPNETSPLLGGSADFDGTVECQAEQTRISYVRAVSAKTHGGFISYSLFSALVHGHRHFHLRDKSDPHRGVYVSISDIGSQTDKGNYPGYPSIGNEFKQLQNTSWIATSYLITVTSFQ